MQYNQEVVLAILRSKPWFVKKAAEKGEMKVFETTMFAYTHDDIWEYIFKKTGKLYSSEVDPFDPVILAEVLNEDPINKV